MKSDNNDKTTHKAKNLKIRNDDAKKDEMVIMNIHERCGYMSPPDAKLKLEFCKMCIICKTTRLICAGANTAVESEGVYHIAIGNLFECGVGRKRWGLVMK